MKVWIMTVSQTEFSQDEGRLCMNSTSKNRRSFEVMFVVKMIRQKGILDQYKTIGKRHESTLV